MPTDPSNPLTYLLGPPVYKDWLLLSAKTIRALLWAFLVASWVFVSARVANGQLPTKSLGTYAICHVWIGCATSDVQILYMLLASLGGNEMVVAAMGRGRARAMNVVAFVGTWWIGLCFYLWPRELGEMGSSATVASTSALRGLG
ncbi:hypothetical protein MCOR25_007290 [Pyricularia grisea]|uniref:Uncharacterized protein n=1 Tax=Pyricularia grisea TaxID=148305 RepID=A0A6P8B405_PYRGI|nr:hypothetical protein PgNI_05414 [Pyricularia grisea]KAI6358606.1 hypothetical protein MCOR25_007290 [Pyricularia grisea]TLD09975.1 hypothetical protein PgNI_05414 [Pyricularia grisea]